MEIKRSGGSINNTIARSMETKGNSTVSMVDESSKNATRSDQITLSKKGTSYVTTREQAEAIGNLTVREYELDRKMFEKFKDFYRGNVSEKEIEQSVYEYFDSLKEILTEKADLKGVPCPTDERILKMVSQSTAHGIGYAATYVDQEKAGEYAEAYGGLQDLDWAYYDADTYYQSKSFEAAMDRGIETLMKEIGMDPSKKSSLCMGREDLSYNAMWNRSYDVQYMFGEIPLDSVPPKGFRLFYKDKMASTAEMLAGTRYLVSASDPFATGEEEGGFSWYMSVPQGKPFLREGSLLSMLDLGKRFEQDPSVFLLDLDQYLYAEGYQPNQLATRLSEFVQENLICYNNGILVVGDGDFEKQTEIPKMAYGSSNREMMNYNYMNYGKLEETDTSRYQEYNSFMSNFTLRRR